MAPSSSTASTLQRKTHQPSPRLSTTLSVGNPDGGGIHHYTSGEPEKTKPHHYTNGSIEGFRRHGCDQETVVCVFVFFHVFPVIRIEESGEGSPARRGKLGTTQVGLEKHRRRASPPRDTTGRERYRERQCLRDTGRRSARRAPEVDHDRLFLAVRLSYRLKRLT